MGIQKKKNMIVITVCTISSFILYQLYFFFTITAETGATGTGEEPDRKILYAAYDVNGNRVLPVLDPNALNGYDIIQLHTEKDKYINEFGLIRGVLFSHIVFYRTGKDDYFKCLKSEHTILYSQINDDFCDCEDGSDEPSTGACPNSIFYCDFQYFKKPVQLNMVPSGKVNDGICDCCDGSDEFDRKHTSLLSQLVKSSRHYADSCLNTC